MSQIWFIFAVSIDWKWTIIDDEIKWQNKNLVAEIPAINKLYIFVNQLVWCS